jgi:putative spermidine/putrescine transport system substrate-binding protein
MGDRSVSRRLVLGGMAGMAAGGPTGLGAQPLPLPAQPVALTIIDVAGNLQLTQVGIERFRTQNPKLVSRINYQRAPSPELPGKLKAQQAAGRVDLDLVLTGPGAMSDGVEQGLWIEVWSKHAEALPKPEATYHEAALMMQRNFGRDQGVAVAYSPSGPIFEYHADKVRTVPKTAGDFLQWVKANPNRFTYARPANSGPGWTFLMGMPYILGDSDPKDPIKGWDKTWAWLKELDNAIDHYPGNTTASMREFGEGSRDIVVSTCGWDINPRVLGIVPKEVEVFALDGTHWVPDTQFMCIPKGVPPEKVAVLLQLMAFMLKPEQQALTYDKGYFYPGPAAKDVTLAMAPAESQEVVRDYGRPLYAKLIAELPVETPLAPDRLVAAFRRWDQEVGAKKARQ